MVIPSNGRPSQDDKAVVARSHSPKTGNLSAFALSCFLAIAGAAFVVGAVFSIGVLLTSFPVVASAAIAFCIWVAILNLLITKNTTAGTLVATVLLGAAAIVAALSGLLVVSLDWITLRLTGAAVTALYACALAFGALKALTLLWRIVAGLTAVAMTVAVLVIPPRMPAAAADVEEWRVSVHVIDPDAHPIEGAVAHCIAGAIWNRETPLSLGKGVKQTDADGRAGAWTFKDIAPGKAAICSAAKDGKEIGPDYPMQTAAVASVFPGGDFSVEINLTPTD